MFSSARRLPSVRHLRLALATVVIACLAAPLASAAAAITHYAAPDGTGSAPCVEPTEPCSIEDAVAFGNIADGDTVLLAPGTYTPAATLEVGRAVTISGEPGKPAPLIEATGVRGLVVQAAATVRDVDIYSPAGTSYGFVAEAGTTVERVESVGEAATTACAFGTVTVRDTVCSATPLLGGGEGVSMFSSGPTPETVEANLFNVTAIGGYVGLFAGANQNITMILNATNTIAAGGQSDIRATSFSLTAPVSINLSHSNYEIIEVEGIGPISVTSPTLAGNQTAEPLFVDFAAGNYRELEASPTRLAGDPSVVLPGELDLDGQPRVKACSGLVDIGAYQAESACPPPVTHGPVHSPPDDKNPETQKPPPLAPTAPKLSKLAIRPTKFVVAGAGKVPKGTARSAALTFTLSEAASVRFEVTAKKAAKGKKPKPITFSRAGVTGSNTINLSGKLNGKALEPGKYTLRVTATADSLNSTSLTKPFEVLPAAS